MHFSASGSSFGLYLQGKIWGIFTVARPFLDRRNFFHDFFVLVFFQDEVEQISSWKFFKWSRFASRILPPKCIH